MKEIIKRLELIKTSIAIDEDEIIELQVMKLNKLDINSEAKDILNKIENDKFTTVISDIENYISKYSGIVVYEDTEVVGLKLELKKLEQKLQNLSEQKTEYLNDIDEFNTQYNLHLGDMIQKILQLKKEILYAQTLEQQKLKEKYKEDTTIYKDTKDTISEIEDAIDEFEKILKDIDKDDENYNKIDQTYKELKEELKKLQDELNSQYEQLKDTQELLEDDDIYEEYEDIKSTYEQFESEYKDIKDKELDRFDISSEDKKELKKLWKKACKLCHPDIVADELKEKAHDIMQALNDVYSNRDMVAVTKILSKLENGTSFDLSSDTIEDKELLKERIVDIKNGIEDIVSELNEIKEDDTFMVINELEDWNMYFEELKTGLQEEIQKLEDESNGIVEEKEEVFLFETIIAPEQSAYSKYISEIATPNFERIRRYCNNLANDNQADTMKEYLAKNSKIQKALIYNALEQFIEQIDSKSITLIDWGSGQGISSSLVLDYIKEKQIDIIVKKVILIDDDAEALSRAMVHVNILSQDDIEIVAIDSKSSDAIKKINIDENSISLNLFANDKTPIDTLDIEYDIFSDAYFVCVSNTNQDIVNNIYEDFDTFLDNCEVLTNRDVKIGRFQKYEIIFKTTNVIQNYEQQIPSIDIDNDEIPF